MSRRGSIILRRTHWLTARAAVLASLCVGTVVTAAEPIVLACTWPGGVETYKVSTDQWQDWNPTSWSWKTRECVDGDFYQNPINEAGYEELPNGVSKHMAGCIVTISEDKLEWEMHGNVYLTVTSLGTAIQDYLFKQISIDRTSGAGHFRSDFRSERWGGLDQVPPSNVRLEATCEKAEDPSLKPRPAPPPKKF